MSCTGTVGTVSCGATGEVLVVSCCDNPPESTANSRRGGRRSNTQYNGHHGSPPVFSGGTGASPSPIKPISPFTLTRIVGTTPPPFNPYTPITGTNSAPGSAVNEN